MISRGVSGPPGHWPPTPPAPRDGPSGPYLPPEENGPRCRPWSWLPPMLWCCPRCATTILPREAGVRCPRCGFEEGT
jgi:hypothetical protein